MGDPEETPEGNAAPATIVQDASKAGKAQVKDKPKAKPKPTGKTAPKSSQKKEADMLAKKKDLDESEGCDNEEALMDVAGVKVSKGVAIGAVIVVLVLAGVIIMLGQKNVTPIGATTATTVKTAGNGVAAATDIVSVDYTGWYENGTVFDTSVKDVAQASGTYNPLRTYEPITFTLGSGGIIKGFDTAIVGMKVGQEKNVTLPPEEAYGYPSPQYIQSVERYQRSPIVQNVSIDKFTADIGKPPVKGMTFSIENQTDYSIKWPMTVLEVYNDTTVIRYEPDSNITINTVFGPAEVYGTADEIIIKINPTVGQKIVTVAGPATVLAVNDENATLDFNPPLAGKTLKFNIKVTSLAKQ